MSPHELIPPIKRSRVLVMVTVISVFIIKAVTDEHVVECGGWFRVAPYPLKWEQKVADVCQNRLASPSADFLKDHTELKG